MTLKEMTAREDAAEPSMAGNDALDCKALRQRHRRASAKKMAKPDEVIGAIASTNYVSTEKEAAAARRLIERREGAKSQMFFDVDYENGGNRVRDVHPDKLVSQISLMDSFSTGYVHVSDALLTQLAKVSTRGHDVSGRELSQAVAMVQGLAPRDETEAMLTVQMVAVHNAVMTTASMFGQAQMPTQKKDVANMLSKLARTFSMQVESLKNWRLNGTQRIHVYHHRGDAVPAAALEPPGGL